MVNAGAQLARSIARKSQHVAGWLRTERDEPVLSVRITDRCPHDPSTYERMAGGHGFCKLCDGFVCCETQAVCRGVGPVIKCNRMHHKLSECPFLFAEVFSGSGRFTEEMCRVLPRTKVKAPSDIKHGPFHDIKSREGKSRRNQVA